MVWSAHHLVRRSKTLSSAGNERSEHTLFRRLRRLLSIMHRIASLAAKLTLMTAVGAGLYLSSLYTDGRKVSNWTTSVASSPEANA